MSHSTDAAGPVERSQRDHEPRPRPAQVEHVVVVGASAGGVEALLTLARVLRPGLPAAICVVIHQPRDSPSALPRLMARAGALAVVHAEHGMVLEAGHVYLAPPNRHLLVERGHLRVDHGPLENGHRPAIDPLFRSAAASYGSEVTAVVLSGLLDDGSAGCVAVKRAGGAILIQDPEEALYGEMPANALHAVGSVDAVVPIRGIVELLDRLRQRTAVPNDPREDTARRDPSDPGGSATPPPDNESPVRHHPDRGRCRVGHGWSLERLVPHLGRSDPEQDLAVPG